MLTHTACHRLADGWQADTGHCSYHACSFLASRDHGTDGGILVKQPIEVNPLDNIKKLEEIVKAVVDKVLAQ